MTMIDVAAAILRDDQGRILICQRGEGGNCAFLWEFPGGKRETGETMEECLIRECREELEIEIALEGLYAETTYAYPDRTIHFNFFNAHIAGGTLKMDVHNDMKWVRNEDLPDYPFCPADEDIIKTLASELARKKKL